MATAAFTTGTVVTPVLVVLATFPIWLVRSACWWLTVVVATSNPFTTCANTPKLSGIAGAIQKAVVIQVDEELVRITVGFSLRKSECAGGVADRTNGLIGNGRMTTVAVTSLALCPCR